ncbi:hypothetical protein K432DRAFT_404290 [Lepidopterella palustris CBS 459.81]|uniref:Uncharacterized protein n=1 Tax=Lepidopterella palustris CBS 459.81 TaxID=1314670 RepID=A0A8E2EBT6_9PEZI|nr:hypothetical protein K432DRAFT_404290 [Lepidopterella palustris CBS 459.81]
MLNAKKLSELLAKNVDPQLYPRMFVMSPNGTLLAYSTPVDIKELRDQAALISMAWKEHEAALRAKKVKGNAKDLLETNQSSSSPRDPLLETLTIEFEHNNIIVRAIQPKLLLILVGGVPPERKASFKITPEAYGDPRYPSSEPSVISKSSGTVISSEEDSPAEHRAIADSEIAKSIAHRPTSIAESHMSQREKDVKAGTLHIQRKKLDAMTDFIRNDFDSKGFVMPDDSSFP